jgi:hypothetical protein
MGRVHVVQKMQLDFYDLGDIATLRKSTYAHNESEAELFS